MENRLLMRAIWMMGAVALVGVLGAAELPVAEVDRFCLLRKETAAFEKWADLAVVLPPEIRTRDIAAYSTNNLTFALNNGLGMTAKGRLWASWIAGGDSHDSYTVASFSDDGGDTWSDVALVIDGHGRTPTRDNLCGRTNIIGTFWLAPDGTFRLYTDQSILHFDGRAGIWESVCVDPDAPVTSWSPAKRLGHGHVLNKPIVLRDGTWAMSGYLNSAWGGLTASRKGAFAALDAERGATCYVSLDKGRSWEKRGTVIFPGRDWQESLLLELKDGSLRVFARVHTKTGAILAADSKDGGRTWSAPFALPSIDNPNARFQIVRLASGRVLFICHGLPSAGGKDKQRRDHLTAYLSEDEGATWQGGLELFAQASSYPDCCQGPDGTIYVTHDHDRGGKAEIWFHRFTEADILARRIVSSRGRLKVLVSRAMASTRNRVVPNKQD